MPSSSFQNDFLFTSRGGPPNQVICRPPAPLIILALEASVFGIYCPVRQHVSSASGARARC